MEKSGLYSLAFVLYLWCMSSSRGISTMGVVMVITVVLIGGVIFSVKRPSLDHTITQRTTDYAAHNTMVMHGALQVGLAEQNDSLQEGVATLVPEGSRTRVIINIDGASAESVEPAHIHTGVCPTPSAVKYPLADVVNGTSETVLDISLEQLLAQLPLAINVHKSSKELKSYVSCGDFPDEMMNAQ